MVKVVLDDAAGATPGGIPYEFEIFDPRSISSTRIVLTAELLEGPFAGEIERTVWTGSFKSSGAGTIDRWEASVLGQRHYTLEFDPGIRTAHLFDDFDAAFTAGIDYTGNRFANLLEGGGGNDHLDGGGGSDTLRGFRGADALIGGGGNDDLDGGRGRDSMAGGSGNDLYRVSLAEGDSVVERADGGHDTIVLLDGWGYYMPDNVEDVRVETETSPGANVIGNDLDNVMRQAAMGGPLGGARGDDLLIGAEGGDFLYGGDGNDEVRGGGGGDVVAGEAGRDRLLGGGGDDWLEGYAGNDRLDGGNGDDNLKGGDGRDVMTGGGGEDLFFFLFATESGASAAARDTITDFVSGIDQVDVSNFASDFIGNGSFTGNGRRGQLSPGHPAGRRRRRRAGRVQRRRSRARRTSRAAISSFRQEGDPEWKSACSTPPAPPSGTEGLNTLGEPNLPDRMRSSNPSSSDRRPGSPGLLEFAIPNLRDRLFRRPRLRDPTRQSGSSGSSAFRASISETREYFDGKLAVKIDLLAPTSAPAVRHRLFGRQLDTGIQFVGNAFANEMHGGEGDDTLRGQGGNDFLAAGLGDDRLFGGEGNDRLFGDLGTDRMAGGTGNDTYVRSVRRRRDRRARRRRPRYRLQQRDHPARAQRRGARPRGLRADRRHRQRRRQRAPRRFGRQRAEGPRRPRQAFGRRRRRHPGRRRRKRRARRRPQPGHPLGRRRRRPLPLRGGAGIRSRRGRPRPDLRLPVRNRHHRPRGHRRAERTGAATTPSPTSARPPSPATPGS